MAKAPYQIKPITENRIRPIKPRYKLEIIQQPEKARACGSTKFFSGRRSIDPPPIVQVSLLDDKGKDVIDHSYNFLVMIAVAEVIDQNEEDFGSAASKKNFKKRKPNFDKNRNNLIFGTTFVSANILTNASSLSNGNSLINAANWAKNEKLNESSEEAANDGEVKLKAFFVFSDISIRYEGYYRFNFKLFEFPLTSVNTSPNSNNFIFRGSIRSSAVKVYNAKYFPGLSASPTLTMAVKNMGSRIRVRKNGNKNASEKDKLYKHLNENHSANNLSVLSSVSLTLQQMNNNYNTINSSTNGNTNTSSSISGTPNQMVGAQHSDMDALGNVSYFNQNSGKSNNLNPNYGYNHQMLYSFPNNYAQFEVGKNVPNESLIADATQTATAAVAQQELLKVDEANIDDEFKKKPQQDSTD